MERKSDLTATFCDYITLSSRWLTHIDFFSRTRKDTNGVHFIATSNVTCNISGKDHTFPHQVKKCSLPFLKRTISRSGDYPELSGIRKQGQTLSVMALEVSENIKNAPSPQLHNACKLKGKTGLLCGIAILSNGNPFIYQPEDVINTCEYNDVNRTFTHFPERKFSFQSFSSAPDVHADNLALSSLLATSAVAAVTSVESRSWRNNVLLSVATITALMSGKFIYSTLFPTQNQGGTLFTVRRVTRESATKSALLVEDKTRLRNRGKIIEYLNQINWISNNKPHDLELAEAIIALIRVNPKRYEPVIARLYLYATGIYGERIHDKLMPAVKKLLVSDMLSQLIFNNTIDNRILKLIESQRYITATEFHRLLTDWNFPGKNRSLVNFYNERYIYPVMPTLSLNFSNSSAKNILTGSATWFFMLLGAQHVWDSGKLNSTEDPLLLTHLGVELLLGMINGEYHIENRSVLELGMKMWSLFVESDRNIESIPDLSVIWRSFLISWHQQLLRTEQQSREVRQAVTAYAEYQNTSWYSHKEATRSMIEEYCGKNATVYIWDKGRRKHTPNPQYQIHCQRKGWYRIIPHGQVKNTGVDVCCLGKDKENEYVNLPPSNVYFRNVVTEYVKRLRDLNKISIDIALTASDFQKQNFSYTDYNILNHSHSSLVFVSLETKMIYNSNGHILAIPVVEVMKDECVLVKSIVNDTKYYYLFYPDRESYNIKALDLFDLENSLKICFPQWDNIGEENIIRFHFNVTTITLKKANESVSVLAEKIAKRTIRNYFNKIYNIGDEPDPFYIVQELVLGFLIPFYSCVTDLKKGEAVDMLLNCSIDIIFVLIPYLRGNVKLFSKLHGILINNINNAIVKAARPADRLLKDVTSLNRLIFNVNHISPKYYKIMVERKVYLVLEAIDPGLSFFWETGVFFKKLPLLIKNENKMAIRDYLYDIFMRKMLKNTNSFADALIRIAKTVDFTHSLARVMKSANRGISYNMRNSDKSEHLSSLVFMNNAWFNLKAFSNTSVIVSELSEMTVNGQRLYSLLDTQGNPPGMMNYICAYDDDAFCNLVPWSAPESDAVQIKLNKTDSSYHHLIDDLSWVSEPIINISRLIYYPDHVVRLLKYGFTEEHHYDVLSLMDTYYLFDEGNSLLHPLYLGDVIVIKTQRDRKKILKLQILTDDNRLLVSRVYLSEKEEAIVHSTQLTPDSNCMNSTLTLKSQGNYLSARVKGKCFPLHPDNFKSWFLIRPDNPCYPSIRLSWSSKDKQLLPVKLYRGENSAHSSFSLESLAEDILTSCDKYEIDNSYTVLVNGLVRYNGQLWLKINHYFLALGNWRGELLPLYCDTTHQIAAWLRYDLYTETFEEVYRGDNWDNASKLLPEAESDFEKLARSHFTGSEYRKVGEYLDMRGKPHSNALIRRLHYTAFLQHIHPVDRMESLSLPSAQLNSWTLHSEALSLMPRFSAMAIWLSWQHRLAHLWQAEAPPYEILNVKRLSLNNSYINNQPIKGVLISANSGDSEGIWLEDKKTRQAVVNQSPGVQLYQLLGNFYGINITSDEVGIRWVPSVRDSLSATLTQFMYDKDPHNQFFCDLYRKKVHVYHPQYGLLSLNNTAQIRYLYTSPADSRMVLIDINNNITVFSFTSDVQDGTAIKGTSLWVDNTDPLLLSANRMALHFVDDSGIFYFAGNFTWHSYSESVALWAPPPGYFPVFVSPDQRFLGFHNTATGRLIILYDRAKQQALHLMVPDPLISRTPLTLFSVALSPLNALIAVALDGRNILIYDLINSDVVGMRGPLAIIRIAIPSDVPENDVEIFPGNIILRFDGIFQHLAVIFNAVTHNGTITNFYIDYYPLTEDQD